MSLRVSLVEDHPVLRDVLQEYIGQLPGVELCVVSANAEDALDEFEGSMPDLMLTDLSLPRMSGIELIRELHLRQPDLRCAIISGHRAPAYVRQAMDAGADGYLLKGDPMEIERGLQALLACERYVSPELRHA
jgi:DNA-binding NarL/FixJ family response regulator